MLGPGFERRHLGATALPLGSGPHCLLRTYFLPGQKEEAGRLWGSRHLAAGSPRLACELPAVGHVIRPRVPRCALHRWISLIELIVVSGGDCLSVGKVAGYCVIVIKVRGHLITIYEPSSMSWAVSLGLPPAHTLPSGAAGVGIPPGCRPTKCGHGSGAVGWSQLTSGSRPLSRKLPLSGEMRHTYVVTLQCCGDSMLSDLKAWL